MKDSKSKFYCDTCRHTINIMRAYSIYCSNDHYFFCSRSCMHKWEYADRAKPKNEYLSKLIIGNDQEIGYVSKYLSLSQKEIRKKFTIYKRGGLEEVDDLEVAVYVVENGLKLPPLKDMGLYSVEW